MMYLEHVIRKYARSLRKTPEKLDLPIFLIVEKIPEIDNGDQIFTN